MTNSFLKKTKALKTNLQKTRGEAPWPPFPLLPTQSLHCPLDTRPCPSPTEKKKKHATLWKFHWMLFCLRKKANDAPCVYFSVEKILLDRFTKKNTSFFSCKSRWSILICLLTKSFLSWLLSKTKNAPPISSSKNGIPNCTSALLRFFWSETPSTCSVYCQDVGKGWSCFYLWTHSVPRCGFEKTYLHYIQCVCV